MASLNHWTKSALECYERKGKCEGCFYNKFFNRNDYNNMQPCQMKKRVIEIIKTIGLPKDKGVF